MRRAHPLSVALGFGGALACACAQISAVTEIHTVVRPDARPILSETRVVERALEVRWSQRGRDLELELRELRQCQSVAHLPARQEERIVRKPDGMIYWEYGLAAVALGVSALAFARPELFAAEPAYDPDRGHFRRDPKTGYRLGGLLGAIGSGFLTAAVVDTVRARDQVRRSDAVALREGPVQPCDPPASPAGARAVELVVGDRTLTGTSDLDGRVRFELPAEAPENDMSEQPDDSLRPIAASLRVGFVGTLPLALIAPYAQTLAAPHTGTVQSGPL